MARLGTETRMFRRLTILTGILALRPHARRLLEMRLLVGRGPARRLQGRLPEIDGAAYFTASTPVRSVGHRDRREIRILVGRLGAVHPDGAKTERGRAHRIPAVRRYEHHVGRLAGELRRDQRIDLRPGLEHLHGIDRKHRIERTLQACRLHRRRHHRRRAVGQDRGRVAPCAQLLQHLERVRVSVKLEIGVEQRGPERAVDRRKAFEAVIQRPLGERPELDVTAGQRMGPGVFDLLDPPHFGEAVGIRSGRRAVAGDRGIEVEQRAVGVEHVGHGNASDQHFSWAGDGPARYGRANFTGRGPPCRGNPGPKRNVLPL